MAYFDSVSASAPLVWFRLHGSTTTPIPAPSYHRYWRVYIYLANGSSNMSMAELEMHNTAGGANVCASTGASDASSYYQNNATYNSSKSFDGNINTFWASNTTSPTPAWILYDFGAGNSASIAEIVVTARNDSFYSSQSPTLLDMQWSDDRSTWNTYWNWNDTSAWTQGGSKTINASTSTGAAIMDSGQLGVTGTFTQLQSSNFGIISGSATGSNIAYYAGVPFSSCFIASTGTLANWAGQTPLTSAFNFVNPFDTASNPSGSGWSIEFLARCLSYNPTTNMMIAYVGNTDGFLGGIGVYVGNTIVGPQQSENLTLSWDWQSGSHQTGQNVFGMDYQHVNFADGQWHHVIISTMHQQYPARPLSYAMIDGRSQIQTYAGSWPSTAVPIPQWMQNYTASFPSFRFGVGSNTYYTYSPNSLLLGEISFYNRFLSASESLDHFCQLVAGSGTLSGSTYLLSSEPIYTVQLPGRAVVVPSSGTGAGREARASKANPGTN